MRMKSIRATISKYNERSRNVLIYLFLMGVCYFFVTNWARSVLFFCLLPFQMSLVCRVFMDRETRGTGMFRIVTAFLIWMFIAYMLVDGWNAEGMVTLLSMLMSWYAALFVIDKTDYSDMRREVFTAGMMFIVCYMPLMLLAVLSLFTGRVIRLPFDKNPIGIQELGAIGTRFRIMSHPNITARVAVFNVLFSVYGIITHRKKALRVFLVFAILLNLMILAHTQSRTCYIVLGIALGMIAFRGVFLAVKKKGVRIIAALLVLVLVVLGVMYGLDGLLKLDIAVARRTSRVVQENISVRSDDLALFDTRMSGRSMIWESILRYLKDNPRYLITGMGTQSIIDVVSETYEEISSIAHAHSAYLNVLARGGILGLLLLLAFLIGLVSPAWRTLTAAETKESRGLFILPVFVVTCLCMCLTETGLFIDPGYLNYLMMAAAGLMLHYARMLKG